MITSSPVAKACSLIIAGTLLVGAVRIGMPEMETKIEGGAQAAAAKMGSTFEDMTAGTLTADPVEEMTPTQTPQETVETVVIKQTATTEPTATHPPEITETRPPTPSLTTPSAAKMPTVTAAMTQPVLDALVPTPTPVQTPIVRATTPTAIAIETVAAQDPTTTAPPQSSRPKRRDPDLAAKAAAERPEPKVAKAKPQIKKPKSQRGGAKRNNTQGAANGNNQQAKATSQGTAKKVSAQSGNAAASNYPGQVMRRISRVPAPRVNSRSTAVVAFLISGNGGLSDISVSSSSGSASLDKAAVSIIRKALPFPVPPKGAQRQYFIKIRGR